MAEQLSVRRSAAGSTQHKSVGRGFRFVTGDMDGPLFAIVIALLVIGLIMMFSASYPAAIEDGHSGTFYAVKQLKFALFGVAAMVVFGTVVDYHLFQKLWISGGAFAVSLLMLVLVLFVGETQGTFATRWLTLPGIGLTFQPSEVMKFSIVVFFATMIVRNANRMNTFRFGVVPFMGMLGIVCVLMLLQPHISGTIIIAVLAMTLLFVGGMKLSHFFGICIAGVAAIGGYILMKVINNGGSYIKDRFISWWDPFNVSYMQDETWQTCQSLIAIGSGGFFGLGLGASRQKYQYLPEPQNDFVFAILCEEFGFVGAATVILLFCLLIFRGFYIAAKANDKFGMLVAVGLTMHIGLQALLNIAVVSNMIPNTGISLPFFSYGGTALVMQLIEMGILLNISRQAHLN